MMFLVLLLLCQQRTNHRFCGVPLIYLGLTQCEYFLLALLYYYFNGGNFSPLDCSENPSLINKSEGCDQSARDISEQGFRTIEKCSQNVLRNVVQLHMGDENLTNCAKIDMVDFPQMLVLFLVCDAKSHFAIVAWFVDRICLLGKST